MLRREAFTFLSQRLQTLRIVLVITSIRRQAAVQARHAGTVRKEAARADDPLLSHARRFAPLPLCKSAPPVFTEDTQPCLATLRYPRGGT